MSRSQGLIRTKQEIANQASGFVFIRNEADETEDLAKAGVNQEQDEDEEDDEYDDDEEAEDVDIDEEDEDVDEIKNNEEDWTDEDDVNNAMEKLEMREDDEDSPRAEESPSTSTAAGKGVEAPVRKGTEIKLVNMELGENVALLRLVGLALVAQCSKCKKKMEATLGPGRTQSKTCEKCRTTMTVIINRI